MRSCFDHVKGYLRALNLTNMSDSLGIRARTRGAARLPIPSRVRGCSGFARLANPLESRLYEFARLRFRLVTTSLGVFRISKDTDTEQSPNIRAGTGRRIKGSARLIDWHMTDPRPIGPEVRAKIASAWQDILDAVAECKLTLEQAAEQYAGVGIRSVQRYARSTPGARAELDDALTDGAELMVARIPSLILDTPDARRARVLAEFAWKIAASRDPKRFGDRSRVTMDIRTLDLTDIVTAASKRLADSRAQRVIDAEVIKPALESLL